MSDETAVGWIREVVLDGPDPWALARFWADLAQARADLPTPGTGRPSSR